MKSDVKKSTLWRVIYILLFIYIVLMALATFSPLNVATLHIYHSWWFIGLEGVLAVCLSVMLVSGGWFRRRNRGGILLHLAFIVILAGAAITHFFGFEGIVHLREGEQTNFMLVNDQQGRYSLPFDIKLDDFRIQRYPGSGSPSSYESDLEIIQEGVARKVTVGMNRVSNIDGFRIFQTSFDKDEQGTVLTVNYDCPGMQVTYLGYLLLLAGMVWTLFDKNSRFRYLSRQLKAVGNGKKAVLSVAFLFCLLSEGGAMPQVPVEHAAKFGQLAVQNPKGRIEPANTWTSAILRKLYQGEQFRGINADQFFLGLLVFPEEWQKLPFIRVKNKVLAEKLGKQGGYISYQDVFDSRGNYILAGEVEAAYAKSSADRNGYENDLLKLDECVNIVFRIMRGQLLPLFPQEQNTQGKWFSAGDDLSGFQGKDSLFVSRIMVWYTDEVSAGLKSGKWQEADKVLDMINTYQQAKNRIIPVDPTRLRMELLYNKLSVFSWSRTLYLIFGGLLLFVVFMSLLKNLWRGMWLCRILTGIVCCIFAWHTLGLGLRWYISGYAPWSNSYESMVFVAWVIVLAGLIFARRFYVLPALAALLAGVLLFVSGLNRMNPEITPLVPVLQSYWLMLHVAVIMTGYGFFAICGLTGLFNLSLMAGRTSGSREKFNLIVRNLTLLNEMAMIVGLIFMTAGTFLGAVWANEAWGRYWGWDPKETWALISIIVYALVSHLYIFFRMKRLTYWFNLLSVLSLGVIIMTYFGVNYYLSGLHSYGKSEAGLLPVPFVVVLSVIALIAGLAWRKERREPLLPA